MTATNPFATEEAWDVNTGTFLGIGDHVCEVREIDGTGNSSGNHPQIEVKVANGDGEIRDWIVVIPSTIGKVIQLTDACGLRRPNDEEVVPEGTGFRLADAYLQQLVGKRVGVIVRGEPDRNDPQRIRERVKGYVDAGKIAASDVTPSGPNTADQSTVVEGPNGPMTFPSAAAAKNDDPIPF